MVGKSTTGTWWFSTTDKPAAWMIAALCIALLPQWSSMPWHLVALCMVPLVWRLMILLRGWPVPPALVKWLLTGASLWVLYASYGNLLGRRAAVGMLALMLCLKLLETFRIREARIVTSLGLFMCTTQFMFSQGPLMVLYGLGCMVSALICFALLARQEAFGGTRSPAPAGPGVRAELRYTAVLIAITLPIVIAFFLLFPRWSSPLWGIPERSLDARSGLSDTMTPGSIQNLFMDDSPAFRANFETGLPLREDLYWRGPVLWNFDGRTWSAGFYGNNIDSTAQPDADRARYRYSVQLEPTERRSLFALDYPATIPPDARLTLDFQLISKRSVTQLKSYQMSSDPGFTDSLELSQTLRQRALDLPADYNPRTREMMQQWRAEARSDAELVRRSLAHFNQERFSYTLNPPLLTRNTVDEFLFDTRAGFCEHYASAFAVMMRMAGVPARVVTGYQGGWFNEFGQYVLVRQSDAHAWTEVWLPAVGWTRVDPTAAVAPSRVNQGALDALGERRYLFDYGWVRQFRNAADWLGRSWNNWVIAFDTRQQSRFLQWLGLESLGNRALVALLAVAMVLMSVLLAPWLLRIRIRTHKDPVVITWLKFRRRLASAGVTSRASMGPMELAERACGLLKQQADEIHTITDLYLRLRYSRYAGDVQALQQAVRQFSVKS